jgi:uncharacterized protein with GYD domain
MAMYLIKFSYTAETWQRLLANPEDRGEAIRPMIEAAGGTLHGFWYAFGDDDGYVLIEATDDVKVAGICVKTASSGAFSRFSTTKLLAVDEALDALRQGGGVQYRAPGAST